jgi:hypothetical protein
MDSEISGLENRHAFLKLGNNVARFHFDYMDVPQRTRGFIARDMEDDALGFDPITLIPKAQPAREPTIDLEADVPKVKAGDSPKVEDTVVPLADEPTEEELAVTRTDPDSPVDSGEVQDEVGVQSTLDFVGR